MIVYTVVAGFSAPSLKTSFEIGDTIGKVESRVGVVADSTEFENLAFWNWLGSENGGLFVTQTGIVPDPSSGGTDVFGGYVAIPINESSLEVSVARWGFVPSGIAVSISKPVGGDNVFATIRAGSITATGFIVDLSSSVLVEGHYLHYVVME